MLGKQIAFIITYAFYLWLMGQTRLKINDGEFTSWKNQMIKKLDVRI